MPKGIPKNGMNKGWFKKGLKPHNFGKLKTKKLRCKKCKKISTVSNCNKNKFCSLKCFHLYRKGFPRISNRSENNYKWKGGKTKTVQGYISSIKRPLTGRGRGHYVREHRLIMEGYLGRKLSLQEIVHHINKNKTDNRIENLMLFKNQKEHLSWHKKNRR